MPQNYIYVSQNPYWIRIRKSKNCLFCSAPISFTFELSKETLTTTTKQPTTLDNSIEKNISYKKILLTILMHLFLIPDFCGHRPSLPKISSILKIVGGNDAIPNSWPWQVYITNDASLCGASLINNQVFMQ